MVIIYYTFISNFLLMHHRPSFSKVARLVSNAPAEVRPKWWPISGKLRTLENCPATSHAVKEGLAHDKDRGVISGGHAT